MSFHIFQQLKTWSCCNQLNFIGDTPKCIDSYYNNCYETTGKWEEGLGVKTQYMADKSKN